MANTFHVSMVSADRQLYSGEAERLVATAERGELGILAGHAPFLSILKAGQVRLTLPDGKEEVIYISGGFIEVQQGQTIILADDAERAEQLDEERVREARRRAEEKMRDKTSTKLELARAQAELAQTMAQLAAIRRAKN
ncbi:F0F1 ATP synthase subunit epsilon [Cardiobacterium valvarum]|jgi:ATP synthase F1, epsilon subunit|uniref:ATP synthase epsilon chain n=1 Tax=Cardiobacterium valvarum F0432 TaxID=797473 RepID=G9ZC51_9GAMM|nr:F0F1 ATP synthase subunit epsilon [Cardiobacterium valvarum]EHM55896.1 ATP synthase F1, epsilon subunit [Cardiobacterium valvarum F0432]